MTKSSSMLVVALALAAAGRALPQPSGEAPQAVPVEEAPYHVPAFRNELVTVLNVLIPPQRTSGYHRHSLDSVGVLVNDTLMNYFCVEAPLGGVKASGLGTRHGLEGLLQFTRAETILEDAPVLGALSAPLARFLGAPYNPIAFRWLRRVMKWLY